MSSATALTIIAVSVGILAILAIVGVIFMLRLVLHLLAFEQTVVRELAELKQLAAQLRETSERVGQTVHDVQTAARRLGGAVGTVASLLSFAFGRSNTRRERLRPWWMTGASVGLTLLRRRRQAKKQKPRREKPQKPSVPGGSDSSLTM